MIEWLKPEDIDEIEINALGDAQKFDPHNYYFKSSNYIRYVDGTEPDYTTLISGGRVCAKSLTAENIKPMSPTISFEDLYGGQDDTV